MDLIKQKLHCLIPDESTASGMAKQKQCAKPTVTNEAVSCKIHNYWYLLWERHKLLCYSMLSLLSLLWEKDQPM